MRIGSVVLLAGLMALPANGEDLSVSVMSFNVWHKDDGGGGDGQDREGLIEAVEAGGAGIVGFQEMIASHGQYIAGELGMNYDAGSSIASQYPILDTSFSHGIRVELSPGKEAYVFNIHLPATPYGPYQLASIPYGNWPFYDPNNAEDLISVVQDQSGRLNQVRGVLDEMEVAIESGLPVFFTGDFNEPSHLDWTADAVAGGVKPAVVPWSTSLAVLGAGLSDSYRDIYVDEVVEPGNTWTPRPSEYAFPNDQENHPEPLDRIDFVYYGGLGVSVVSSGSVGPVDGVSNIEVADFGSDHRGVVSEFLLSDVAFSGTKLSFAGMHWNLIDQGYGDRRNGTPHVGISYASEGGGELKGYKDDRWGGSVVMLDSGSGSEVADGVAYEMVLAADEGFTSMITGFDLIDWADWDPDGHTVLWSILDDDGLIVVSGEAVVPDDESLHVETGLAVGIAGELTLRLEHLSGWNNKLALDNVVIVEGSVVSVPEPSSILLGMVGVLGFMRRRINK